MDRSPRPADSPPLALEADRTSRDDAAYCARIVRSHAKTFALASRFLPAAKRRAAFALYAFCRVADDMVDAGAPAGDAGTARRLADYDRELALAVAGRPRGPLFRELHRVVRDYGVPESVLHDLIEGVARDLRPVRYASWPDLALYCEGVASTVGEMCTYVFGVPGGADRRRAALRYARALGVAMQLTNILRDVGEDARRGRCYLPDEDLAQFGLMREEVLAAAGPDPESGPAVHIVPPASGAPAALSSPLARDPRWRRLMRFEIRRARAIYEATIPGIALLSPDSRRCASACAWGYAGILGAIEQNGYDSLGVRARLAGWARMSVLWEAWRAPAVAVPLADGPVIDWSEVNGAAADELLRWA